MTRRGAAGKHPPAPLRGPQARRPGFPAGKVDHDVAPLLAGGEPGGLREILFRVIDDAIGAQGRQALAFLRRAGRGDHRRSGHFAELEAGHSDAAARSQHQHGLARREPSPRIEHAVRGAVGDGDRRRGLEGQIVGQANQVPGGHDDEFGKPARDLLAHHAAVGLRVHGHALTGRPAFDSRPERIDRAGHVAAGDERHRHREPRHPPPHENVEMVEPAGLHRHADLARTRFGVGPVAVDDVLDRALSFDDRRFQRIPP